MAKVTGLGGIFFKARDPKGLSAWYAQHLGLRLEEFGGALFRDDASQPGHIVSVNIDPSCPFM